MFDKLTKEQEVTHYYKTANAIEKFQDIDNVKSIVQDSLQTLVDNFNLNETELREVIEESIHNLIDVPEEE